MPPLSSSQPGTAAFRAALHQRHPDQGVLIQLEGDARVPCMWLGRAVLRAPTVGMSK